MADGRQHRRMPRDVRYLGVAAVALQVLAFVLNLVLITAVHVPVETAAMFGFGLAVISFICLIAAFALTTGSWAFTHAIVSVLLVFSAQSVGFGMIMAGLPAFVGAGCTVGMFIVGFIIGLMEFFRPKAR